MYFYKHLYVGEQAKKHRFSIIQKIRNQEIQRGVYLLTPASNDSNILDIVPSMTWQQMEQWNQMENEPLIVGIAEGYEDALLLAGRIVEEMYRETGMFHLRSFLENK